MTILLFALLALVLLILFTGIGGMLLGGEFNKKYGNKLMQLRVLCQGLAVLVIVLMMLAGKP